MPDLPPPRRRARNQDPLDEPDLDDWDEDEPAERLTPREFKRVKNVLSYVRAILGLFGAVTLSSSLVALGLGSEALGTENWLIWALIALGTVEIIGAILLLHAPMPWLLLTAGLSGLSVVGNLVSSGGRVGLMDLLFAACTVALIAAIPQVHRAMRTFEGMTPQQRLDRLRGRYRTTAAESSTRLRRRSASRKESNNNQMRLIAAVAVAGVVVALGFGVAKIASKPSPIEPRVEDFGSALGAGRLEEARALCSEEYASDRWAKAVRILKREEWDDGVEIGAPRVTPRTDSTAQVDYDLPRGKLKTAWKYLDGEWRVTGVVFSRVRER